MADISKFIEKAENEVKRRNYDTAMQLFGDILKIDPDCGEARSGVRRAALKKFEKSYPSGLVRGLLNFPNNLLLPFARVFRAHGGVVGLCEMALRRDPKNVRLNHLLGHALLSQGHRKSAEAAFAVVTEFDPKDIESLKTLGSLLYERKDLEGALACFEKALKINPRDQDAAKMRKNLAAEGAIKTGGFENARSARDLAKSQRQLDDAERAQKIVRSSADLAEAIEEMAAAVSQNPDDHKLKLKLAQLLMQDRKFDEAVELLIEAKRTAPEDPEILERLGEARIQRLELRLQAAKTEADAGEDGADDKLRRLKRDLAELQIEEFQRRVALHPTDMSLRFRLGQFLLRDGQIEESIEQFQKAVKDPRHRLAAQHLLGRAFGRAGMHDLAVKQLEDAAQSQSGMGEKHKDILYDLAKVHEVSGAKDEALRIYKQIYESDIGYRDVQARISELSKA